MKTIFNPYLGPHRILKNMSGRSYARECIGDKTPGLAYFLSVGSPGP